MNKEKMISYLHKLYKEDLYFNALLNAIGINLDFIDKKVEQANNNMFFDICDSKTLSFYEKEANIIPKITQTREERAEALSAKWRSEGKTDIQLLQSVCNAWKNGKTSVSFETGMINIKFVGEYGVPTDIEALKKALEDVKPAHLKINYEFSYVLLKEIETMTLSEVETMTLNKFAGGEV